MLVVDLTDDRLDGSAIVQALAGEDLLERRAHAGVLLARRHGDGERAREAGFDLVVPRSRMAREGAHLVARLAVA